MRVWTGSAALSRTRKASIPTAPHFEQFARIAESTRQKGTRPDFSHAARPEAAEPLYERFCTELRALDVAVELSSAVGPRSRRVE